MTPTPPLPPTNPLPLVKPSRRHRAKAQPVSLVKAQPEPEDETPVYTAIMGETKIDPALVSSECDALMAEMAEMANTLWPFSEDDEP